MVFGLLLVVLLLFGAYMFYTGVPKPSVGLPTSPGQLIVGIVLMATAILLAEAVYSGEVKTISIQNYWAFALLISISINFFGLARRDQLGKPFPRKLMAFTLLNCAFFVLVFGPFSWWRH